MRISDWSSDVCSSDLRTSRNAKTVKAMPGDSSMDELIHKMLCSAARCRIDAEYVLKRRGRRGRLGIDHPAHRIDDRGKGNAPRQEGRDRPLARGVAIGRASSRGEGWKKGAKSVV